MNDKPTQDELIHEFKRKYDSLYPRIKHNFEPQHDTLVVSMCGAKKNPISMKQKIYARDMYLGPGNTLLRKNIPTLPVDWVILSGGYGSMWQTSYIRYYDDVIMDISKAKLRDMGDYLRYHRDLKRLIKRGNYRRIIFTISDRWINTINLKELGELAGDKCELIVFLSHERLRDKKFLHPQNMINIDIPHTYLPLFGAPLTAIKEKITISYLKYINENPEIGITDYINDRVKKLKNF